MQQQKLFGFVHITSSISSVVWRGQMCNTHCRYMVYVALDLRDTWFKITSKLFLTMYWPYYNTFGTNTRLFWTLFTHIQTNSEHTKMICVYIHAQNCMPICVSFTPSVLKKIKAQTSRNHAGNQPQTNRRPAEHMQPTSHKQALHQQNTDTHLKEHQQNTHRKPINNQKTTNRTPSETILNRTPYTDRTS